VRPADIENLYLLATEVNRHAVPEGLVRQHGGLLRRRHLVLLHHVEQIGFVIFVADPDDILIGDVAQRIIAVEGRGNQIADGLPDRARNELADFTSFS
jgi:hypothetical protein